MTTPLRSIRAVVAASALGAVLATSLAAPASADLPPSVPDLGFYQGFYLPFNDLPLGDVGDAPVLANGNLAVTWADSTFAGTLVYDETLESFDAGIDLRGAVTVELAAAARGDLSGTWPLAAVPLGGFDFGPVHVEPWVGVNLRVDGRAEAGARVSMVGPFDLGTAFAFDGTASSDLAAEPRFEPEFGAPDAAGAVGFEGRVELEFTLTFLTTVEGLPIGGPVVGTALGVQLRVDSTPPANRPWWDLDGLASVKAGWAAPVLPGEAPGPPDPWGRLGHPLRWDIASAEDPPPLLDSSTRWSRAFDIHNSDAAAAVLPAGDGLIVLEDDHYPWLASLDGLGNPTWQNVATEETRAKAMTYATNGDLLIAGVLGRSSRIERRSPIGDPLWARTLTMPDANFLTVTAIVPSGDGAIVGGKVSRFSGERPIFAAFDGAGELLWATEVDTGLGSTNPAVTALAATPTGDILAVGEVDYDRPDGLIDGRSALVLRVGADGTIDAAYAVGSTHSEYADAIAVHPDGSYAISGQGQPVDGDHRSWVASFRPDDTLHWSSTYADRPDAGWAYATGVAPAPDGGLVISGVTGMYGSEDAWLTQVDAEGMPLWSKSFIGSSDDRFDGVVAVPDGFAAYGSTHTTNNAGTGFHDLWLVRTNRDGMVPFTADSGFDAVNGAVQCTAPIASCTPSNQCPSPPPCLSRMPTAASSRPTPPTNCSPHDLPHIWPVGLPPREAGAWRNCCSSDTGSHRAGPRMRSTLTGRMTTQPTDVPFGRGARVSKADIRSRRSSAKGGGGSRSRQQALALILACGASSTPAVQDVRGRVVSGSSRTPGVSWMVARRSHG